MNTKNTGKHKRHNESAVRHSKKINDWRIWLFRIVAITVIPALVIVLLEVGLRIIGYGFPSNFITTSKINGKGYYCDNVKFTWLFFPPNIAREADCFVFPRKKSENTYRIFVLGESAAKGVPDPAYSFGRILNTMLRHKYQGVNFEVVVAAPTAINSHVILPMARDCAKYQPDLFVVYMGNNEVVGPYGPGTVFSPFYSNISMIRLGIVLKSTRLGQLLANVASLTHNQNDMLKTWGGMEMFTAKQVRAGNPQLKTVYEHFRRNVEDIKRAASKSGAKTILCTVATNIKDSPPFISLHRPDLNDVNKKKWDDIYQQGIENETAGKYSEAATQYLLATEIDDTYADLQFRLGRCCWAMGEYDKARERYVKAQEFDALRFRADVHINSIIRDAAKDGAGQGVYFVDVAKALEEQSSHDTCGKELFYEHVHLNFKGNYLLAKSVFEQVQKILPEEIKRRESSKPLATEDECGKYLAYTEWDKRKVVDEVLNKYIKQIVFANQLYYKERVKELEDELKTLKASMTKDTLERSAAGYRYAINDCNTDWWLYWRYGTLLNEAMKNPKAAVEQFSTAMQYTNCYRIQVAWGGVLGTLVDLNGALKHDFDVLRIKPNCTEACYNIGSAYFLQGKAELAIKYYTKAIESQPDYVMAWNGLITVLYKLGRYEELEKTYRKALVFLPKDEALHYNLGAILRDKGQTDEAIKEFEAALAIDPNSQARKELKALQGFRKAIK